MKSIYRIILSVFLIAAIGAAAAAYIIADRLSAPYLTVAAPPSIPHEDVRLVTTGGLTIAGWLFRGEPEAPAIALFHAIRSNRGSMLARAIFFRTLGYNILVVDLPAHGQSGGDRITFGHSEAGAAAAALEYFKTAFPKSKTAALGQSLGGAALLLGPAPAAFDAVILESVFSDIDRAIANRLEIRLGWFGRMLSPLFTLQLEPRLGVRKSQLNPTQAIRRHDGAVFIISGDKDKHTKPSDTRRLFEAASNPKTLWLVKGAGHEDLHKFAGRRYEHNVKTFLRLHLGA